MNKPLLIAAFMATLFFFAGQAAAADQNQIYGSQMMTEQERMEYRDRLRAAESAEEREKIRNEHHKQMQERAKERGVSIPDEPPARGGGMGPKDGMGPQDGMGPGGGKGRGN